MVSECEEKFEAFSHEVFSREGIVSDDKKSRYPGCGVQAKTEKSL